MFGAVSRSIARLFGWESRSGWWQQIIAQRRAGLGGATEADININEAVAFNLATVYACIRVIAETKASLPIQMFEVSPGSKKLVTQHDIAGLLATQPDPTMTPMVWNETRQLNVLSGGNGYTWIKLNRTTGKVDRLIPLHWSEVEPFKGADGIYYRIQSELYGNDIASAEEMLHVPAIGTGLIGWSPIRLARESIATGLAQERYQAKFFKNGAKPSIVVSTDAPMQPAVYERTKAEIEECYSGVNAHRPMLLEMGKVTPISLPSSDAELMKSRQFTGEEICRFYRIDPALVGFAAAGKSPSSQDLDLRFEKHTIRPWLVRDEQELQRKLLPRKDWGRFVLRHNVEALLRGDIKTRFEAYKIGILSGFLSRNEVRELEGREGVAGGDELLLPEAIFGKGGSGKGTITGQRSGVRRSTRRKLAACGYGTSRGMTPPSAGTSSQPADGDSFAMLGKLTVKVVEGLIQREATHAERAAGKPDFAARIEEFYFRHLDTMYSKLEPVCSDVAGLVDLVEPRHRALLETDGSPEAVRRVIDSWTNEAKRTATALLT